MADSASAAINSLNYISIFRSMEVVVGAGATLTMTATVPEPGVDYSQGVIHMGVTTKDALYPLAGNLTDEDLLGNDREPDGGKITLAANSILILDAGDVSFGGGSSLVMDDTSTLTLTGRLVLGHDDFSFANLSAAGGLRAVDADVTFRKPVAFGGRVGFHFGSNVDVQETITMNGDYFYMMNADLTLRPGKDILGSDEIDFTGYNGDTNVTVFGGSKIASDYFLLGNWYDDGADNKSERDGTARLYVNPDSASPFTIQSNFTHVTGELIVNENAVLAIDASSGSHPYNYDFVMGRTKNDFNNSGPDFSHADLSGLLLMKAGSSAQIAGNSYFGAGSTVDVGLGTLAITGDAAFKENSTYRLQLGGATNGLITVTGTTDIEDGAVVVLTNPEGLVALNKTVLTSATGFANANVFSNPLYSLAQKNSHDIVVDRFLGGEGLVDSVLGGGSGGSGGSSVSAGGNIAAAAALVTNVLSSAGTDPDLINNIVENAVALAELVKTDPGAAATGLRQLFGGDALPALTASVDNVHQIAAVIDGRIGAIRNHFNAPGSGYGPASERVWAAGFGNWAKQKSTPEFEGYRYNAVGVSLGYDHDFASAPGLNLGISASLIKGTLKNNNHLTETDMDSVGLSLYGVYEFGNGLFLEGSLGYGWTENKATINVAYLNAVKKSDFDSRNFRAGLNAGYDIALSENTYLTPSLGVTYINVDQDGWQEKIASDPTNNAVANWFGDSRQNFLEIPLTLKFETQIRAGGAVITPELSAGWIYSAKKPKSEMRMGFVGSDLSATLAGADPGRNRFGLGAGVKAQFNDTVDLSANYEYEGRKKYSSHYSSLTLGLSF
ncbi:MAG: autotransporter outer membrane beta-barrel domain-containing protein [Deltaproteobacteria bacterium]|nr:autotransporter outer membrane beta-barrel domain-containing protein [Deltaproteobacteria bacterium]